MKKTEEEKKVKIMVQGAVIELTSKTSDSQQKPSIKVNGKVVRDEEQLSQQGIESTYNQVYVRKSGVSVQFDGEEAKVKVSGMYKNLQCGLCGHYNDEDEDVFRMGNGQQSNSLKQFHQSYTLKNQECNENKLNKFYEQDSQEFSIDRRSNNQNRRRQQQKNSWFDSDESRQSEENYDEDEETNWMNSNEQKKNRNQPKPIDRTKVVEYQQKICFSTKPVKRCPKGSSPNENAEMQEVKAQFFCLDRSSTEARRLLRQVRQGQVVESEGRPQSFVEDLQQPTKCQAAY